MIKRVLLLLLPLQAMAQPAFAPLPEVFSRIAKVLLPKDYLRLWLSGEAISDMSDASGTAWLNVGKRDWPERLLNATGLDLEHMPALTRDRSLWRRNLSAALVWHWHEKGQAKGRYRL
jgi:xylulokinase